MDLATVDHLLTTTRSVRKRLDFSKPVDPNVVAQCLEIAMQAPTGSNAQGWSFVVVTDPAKRKGIADLYKKGFTLYAEHPELRPTYAEDDLRARQLPRVVDSASFLAEHMHEAPVMVIFCVDGRVENAGVLAQASVYGSILPAAWSFMLALRARGLGTAWTTLHLMFEQDVAKLLGIPDTVTQTALFPVAHFTGTDFKPAKRLPAAQLVHWNGWGGTRVSARLEHPAGHPHVAVVTIDRPAQANALDPPTLRELAAAWRAVASDPDVRCVILTGAGDRVFCAGMDVKTTIPLSQRLARGERLSEDEFEAMRDVPTATLAAFTLGKPLVCAINGHARAGGFDLMLASDLRFAVPDATFALEEVALGLYPTGQATVVLPRQIPWVHAQALLLTARPIDAGQAREMGLVNAVVLPEDLMATAFDAADAIAANAPLAVAATWHGVRELLAMPLEQAYRRQEELGRPLRRTEDAQEAQRAFVEKRRPVWRGR